MVPGMGTTLVKYSTRKSKVPGMSTKIVKYGTRYVGTNLVKYGTFHRIIFTDPPLLFCKNEGSKRSKKKINGSQGQN